MNYQISKHLSWRKLGEHTIILDTVIGKKVHHLNEVGSSIWQLLEKNKNPEEIISELSFDYEKPRNLIEQDVQEFFKLMLTLNLIKEL